MPGSVSPRPRARLVRARIPYIIPPKARKIVRTTKMKKLITPTSHLEEFEELYVNTQPLK